MICLYDNFFLSHFISTRSSLILLEIKYTKFQEDNCSDYLNILGNSIMRHLDLIPIIKVSNYSSTRSIKRINKFFQTFQFKFQFQKKEPTKIIVSRAQTNNQIFSVSGKCTDRLSTSNFLIQANLISWVS